MGAAAGNGRGEEGGQQYALPLAALLISPSLTPQASCLKPQAYCLKPSA